MALTEAPTNKKRPSPTSAANMGPGEPPAKKPAAPRAIISACAPKKSITSLNAQALANAVASTRALPGVARQAKHFEKNGALLTSTHQVWAEFEVEELKKGASTLTKQSTKSFDEDPAPFGAPGSVPQVDPTAPFWFVRRIYAQENYRHGYRWHHQAKSYLNGWQQIQTATFAW